MPRFRTNNQPPGLENTNTATFSVTNLSLLLQNLLCTDYQLAQVSYFANILSKEKSEANAGVSEFFLVIHKKLLERSEVINVPDEILFPDNSIDNDLNGYKLSLSFNAQFLIEGITKKVLVVKPYVITLPCPLQPDRFLEISTPSTNTSQETESINFLVKFELVNSYPEMLEAINLKWPPFHLKAKDSKISAAQNITDNFESDFSYLPGYARATITDYDYLVCRVTLPATDELRLKLVDSSNRLISESSYRKNARRLPVLSLNKKINREALEDVYQVSQWLYLASAYQFKDLILEVIKSLIGRGSLLPELTNQEQSNTINSIYKVNVPYNCLVGQAILDCVHSFNLESFITSSELVSYLKLYESYVKFFLLKETSLKEIIPVYLFLWTSLSYYYSINTEILLLQAYGKIKALINRLSHTAISADDLLFLGIFLNKEKEEMASLPSKSNNQSRPSLFKQIQELLRVNENQDKLKTSGRYFHFTNWFNTRNDGFLFIPTTESATFSLQKYDRTLDYSQLCFLKAPTFNDLDKDSLSAKLDYLTLNALSVLPECDSLFSEEAKKSGLTRLIIDAAKYSYTGILVKAQDLSFISTPYLSSRVLLIKFFSLLKLVDRNRVVNFALLKNLFLELSAISTTTKRNLEKVLSLLFETSWDLSFYNSTIIISVSNIEEEMLTLLREWLPAGVNINIDINIVGNSLIDMSPRLLLEDYSATRFYVPDTQEEYLLGEEQMTYIVFPVTLLNFSDEFIFSSIEEITLV